MLVGPLLGAALLAGGPQLAVDGSAVAAADIRYLLNSGWLVLTRGHVLIFDYVESVGSVYGTETLPRGLAPAFDNYGDRRVVVFVTHSHADHYSPSVFEWAAKNSAIQYLVGSPLPGQAQSARGMNPHEDWSSGGLRVRTTGSTDQGVGFLVAADGITVFHAGDHALWSDSSTEPFEAEIQWLKSQGASIDVAFFPIATGFACEPRPSIWKGVLAAARQIRPRVLVPMHVRCTSQLSLYERFREEISPQLTGTQVVAPSASGEWFRYEAGILSRKTGDVQPNNQLQRARPARASEPRR
jgi:L-ascorbate metabolism protein UlaG (beta-lactamase superfamily)